MGNLKAKWEAFGWNVMEINGHDYAEIANAMSVSRAHHSSPTIIIANTVKGKGISFMEGNAQWHNKIPTEELFQQAFDELERSVVC
jgi:transketolase